MVNRPLVLLFVVILASVPMYGRDGVPAHDGPAAHPVPLDLGSLPHGHKNGLTKHDLDALSVSDAAYLDLLNPIAQSNQRRVLVALNSAESSSPVEPSVVMTLRRLRAGVLSAIYGSSIIWNGSSFSGDDFPDAEPTVFSYADRSGLTYGRFAWMKWNNVDVPANALNDTHHITVTGFTAGINGVGEYSLGVLPHYHSRQADPTFVGNPSDPTNLYLLGTDYDIDSVYPNNGGLNIGANAIVVWKDFTTLPAIIASLDGSSDYFLDKPAGAISAYPSTFGQVYCAFMAISLVNPPGPSTLYVYKQVGASWTLWSSLSFPTNMAPQSPALVVDKASGDVLLFHVDWANDVIYAWRIPATTAQPLGPWPLSLTGVASFYTPSNGTICDSAGGNCIFQRSTLLAKQNPIDGSVAIVFHARVTNPGFGRMPDTYTSRIYFARWNPSFNSWETPFKAITPPGQENYDHWNAALDADNSGNYLVTFYARTNTQDLKYQVAAESVTSLGNVIVGSVLYHPQVTDAGLFRQNNSNLRFMGEYQGVSYTGDRWTAVTIYAPTNRGDAHWINIYP